MTAISKRSSGERRSRRIARPAQRTASASSDHSGQAAHCLRAPGTSRGWFTVPWRLSNRRARVRCGGWCACDGVEAAAACAGDIGAPATTKSVGVVDGWRSDAFNLGVAEHGQKYGYATTNLALYHFSSLFLTTFVRRTVMLFPGRSYVNFFLKRLYWYKLKLSVQYSLF